MLCRYHADNESADLDSFHNATKIISKVRLCSTCRRCMYGECLSRYRPRRMCCGFCSVIVPVWPLLRTITARHCTITFRQKMVGILAYARRLLLLAGASSLYPGVLQEMNYAARRKGLLLFHSSSALGPNIFSRIRNGRR